MHESEYRTISVMHLFEREQPLYPNEQY